MVRAGLADAPIHGARAPALPDPAVRTVAPVLRPPTTGVADCCDPQVRLAGALHRVVPEHEDVRASRVVGEILNARQPVLVCQREPKSAPVSGIEKCSTWWGREPAEPARPAPSVMRVPSSGFAGRA
jgi:hypothetical protein